jgi:hypothetical protein
LIITSSGRGALARTRWVNFNCNDKKAERSDIMEGLQEDRHQNKKHMRSIEKMTTHKFLCPLVVEHREQP